MSTIARGGAGNMGQVLVVVLSIPTRLDMLIKTDSKINCFKIQRSFTPEIFGPGKFTSTS